MVVRDRPQRARAEDARQLRDSGLVERAVDVVVVVVDEHEAAALHERLQVRALLRLKRTGRCPVM
jgi:hypothetical protein